MRTRIHSHTQSYARAYKNAHSFMTYLERGRGEREGGREKERERERERERESG